MNNKNKILVGCLALLLVLSVGYALFSETITINGTATAKGDFDISYTCNVITEETHLNNNVSVDPSTGVGTCKIEDGVIKTTSTLNKPTDAVSYHIVLTNNGSIPAVLKTVDSPNNLAEDLKSSGDFYYLDNTNLIMADYVFTQSEDDMYEGDSTVENAKLTLQPGETLNMSISHVWVSAEILGLDTQPEVPEEGATINYNVSLGFEQVSAN